MKTRKHTISVGVANFLMDQLLSTFSPIHRLKKWNANYYKVQPFAQRFRNPANRKGFLLSFAHISGAQSEHNVISQFHTLRSSSRGNLHEDDADKGKFQWKSFKPNKRKKKVQVSLFVATGFFRFKTEEKYQNRTVNLR